MPTRYVRTPAGQAEIQARTRQLSRPVRNLLLVINDSRSIEEWIVGVHGVTPADVAMLRAEGLIAEVGAAGAAAPAPKPASKPADLREAAKPAAAAPAASAASDADWVRTQHVIRHAGYTALYDALNSMAKAKLGLVRGYRFALEVEKCSGVEEIRPLALKFAEQLRAEHGMAAVGELTYAIGAVKA
ncbi:MAG TPA: hypothetical protein VGQ91_18325 [Ideonella sp.]|nr:hypothetical protein [Ideonella sp.]